MSFPFHLSFIVPDLRESEQFYVEFLNCKKGRDTGDWIDIIFYGHQLTLHQATGEMKAQAIDHFGIILDKASWLLVLEKFNQQDYAFELEPTSAIKDNKSESGKFIVKDPANNLLEFKFYEASPLDVA